MLRRTHTLLGLGLFLLAGFACSKRGDNHKAQEPVRMLVAASTKEAVEEVAALFTKDTGIEVKVIAESSSKLATQIVNDAPADLFLSANEKWADFVKEKGFAHEVR